MTLGEELANVLDRPRPLTGRQKMVLDFIHAYVEQYGVPPTLREIGTAMGIRSTNGVSDHLRALERKGCISRAAWKSRAIRLLSERDTSTLEKRLAGEVAAYRAMLRKLVQATDTLPTMTARLALTIGEAQLLLKRSS